MKNNASITQSRSQPGTVSEHQAYYCEGLLLSERSSSQNANIIPNETIALCVKDNESFESLGSGIISDVSRAMVEKVNENSTHMEGKAAIATVQKTIEVIGDLELPKYNFSKGKATVQAVFSTIYCVSQLQLLQKEGYFSVENIPNTPVTSEIVESQSFNNYYFIVGRDNSRA
ncbi:hypothetical protein QYM36_012361 [Artemia franciscana]|uniref:Uncharacterized protein n=1 Tax=Artemia franciscana TaxID=6661 RepID=A0AA88HNZ1_ARTSF|nr:hypothetical protein QYM36_012361 [Artemia franciscana]